MLKTVEKWKKLDIENYQILISNYGRIFNFKTQRFLKWQVDASAGDKLYLRIKIGRKNYYVHKLVAQMFCKKENQSFDEVDHLDDNGLNPFYKNLVWCDRASNLKKKGANCHVIYRGRKYVQKYKT